MKNIVNQVVNMLAGVALLVSLLAFWILFPFAD